MSTDGHSSGGHDPSASGAQPSTSGTEIGQVIDGRWEITKKLGEGGMGEVYAARHLHIEKQVAVKLLRGEILTNKEAVTRFKQEARSASSIGHENIIKIEDFGELTDGRIYLMMELLDGLPLNDMIKETMLPPERLLDILIQTGHGLAAAHDKQVVHRDMKPENIFVTQENGRDVPKLLDFGIAKVSGADGNNHLTRTGTIFGTPFYMSPEQALGQTVDHRADIYAMGVIMYEVFTGSIPFTGESFMGILTKHITAEPKPPAEMAAEHGRMIPPGVEELICRAMKKDPDERYQTMNELVGALVHVRRHIAGAGMSTYMQAHSPAATQLGQPAGTGSMPGTPGVPSGPHSQVHTSSTPTPMPPGSTVLSGGYARPASASYTPPSVGSGTGQVSPSGAMPAADQSNPYAVTPQRPGAYSDSYAGLEAPKSRIGLWIALVLLLAAGGGAGFYFYWQNNQSQSGGAVAGDDDAGSVEDAGADDADSGNPLAAADAGADDAGADDAGADDAAVAAADAGTPEDAAVPAPKPVNVLLATRPSGATAYVNGEPLEGETPLLVSVVPGEEVTVTLKLRGREDAEVVLDGNKRKVTEKLKRKRRPQPDDPVPFCEQPENKNHPRCKPDEPDPVPFCDRPENKNSLRCLPKDSCRRPENKHKPVCQLE